MKPERHTTTVGHVCRVIAGQSPPGTAYNNDGRGLPFYQGKKEFGPKEIGRPSTWTTETTKVAEPGDILMSVRAPVGPVNFISNRACIGRGLAAIRVTDKIDRQFLFYNLWMRQADLGGKEGAVFASINRAGIEAIEIPLPSLEEQRRIVATLDETFAAIATATAIAEKNLANARALFEAMLANEFQQADSDWKSRTFESCLKRVKYPAKIQRKAFKVEGDFPVVSQESDFINGYWDNPTHVLRVEKPLIVFGDHTQILKYVDFDFVLGADGVKLLLPEDFLDTRFMLYFLLANPIPPKGYARHYRHLKSLDASLPLMNSAALPLRLKNLREQSSNWRA